MCITAPLGCAALLLVSGCVSLCQMLLCQVLPTASHEYTLRTWTRIHAASVAAAYVNMFPRFRGRREDCSRLFARMWMQDAYAANGADGRASWTSNKRGEKKTPID